MCLCEEDLDRKLGRALLFQVYLTLLQTETGGVESVSELEGLGVHIFLRIIGIQAWKFTSHQITQFFIYD